MLLSCADADAVTDCRYCPPPFASIIRLPVCIMLVVDATNLSVTFHQHHRLQRRFCPLCGPPRRPGMHSHELGRERRRFDMDDLGKYKL